MKTFKQIKKSIVDESLGAMIKKKHDKTKKDQEDAKKNIALKSRLKKSGIHVKEESVDEAIDKSSPVYKEYLSLKKKSIKDLRRMVDQQHRGPVDLSGYDKQGAISDLLRNKFGNKAVATAMGLDESIDEARYLSPAEKRFRDQERNAGLEDEGKPSSYAGKKLILLKNGKPLKISGKEVVVKDKNHAQGIVNKLMKQPFNKDAKFSMRAVSESANIEEARQDSAKDVYWQSYSLAVRHALAQAKKKGFEVDEDDIEKEITFGSGKPGRGKTVRHTLKLTKGGKPQKKALHIQVYNRDTDKSPFELNFYIS